jgi:hypothetical protein
VVVEDLEDHHHGGGGVGQGVFERVDLPAVVGGGEHEPSV